jgi:hypothetical protein
MKAYRVVIGNETNIYGTTNYLAKEKAQYFFNEKDAKALYESGKYTVKETVIYTQYADGSVGKSVTGACWYEDTLANKKPNETVVLETKEENHYRLEEIEIN